MTRVSRLATAVCVPAVLTVAMLALSGCVAPPAAVYPGQAYAAPAVAGPTQPYSTPAPQYSTPVYAATFCAAGVYQCPIPGGTPVGTSCACPGLGAPSYGVAQ